MWIKKAGFLKCCCCVLIIDILETPKYEDRVLGYIYELLTRIGLEGVLRDPWLTEDVQTAPALEVGPELTLTDQETLNLVTQTQLKLGLNNLKLEKILEYIR